MPKLFNVVMLASVGGFLGALYDVYNDIKEREKQDLEWQEENPLDPEEYEQDNGIFRTDSRTPVIVEEEELVIIQQDLSANTYRDSIEESVSLAKNTDWLDKVVHEPNHLDVVTLIQTRSIEELETLRVKPDSQGAWNQYVAMRLANINAGLEHDFLYALFSVEFKSNTTEDDLIYPHIQEDRDVFFGDYNPIHDHPYSIAEMILYFIDQLVYHFGEDPSDYAEELIGNIGYYATMTRPDFERLNNALIKHDIFGGHDNEFFGMFGVERGTIGYGQTSFNAQFQSYHGFLDD